jgi:hypothetical protein
MRDEADLGDLTNTRAHEPGARRTEQSAHEAVTSPERQAGGTVENMDYGEGAEQATGDGEPGACPYAGQSRFRLGRRLSEFAPEQLDMEIDKSFRVMGDRFESFRESFVLCQGRAP